MVGRLYVNGALVTKTESPIYQDLLVVLSSPGHFISCLDVRFEVSSNQTSANSEYRLEATNLETGNVLTVRDFTRRDETYTRPFEIVDFTGQMRNSSELIAQKSLRRNIEFKSVGGRGVLYRGTPGKEEYLLLDERGKEFEADRPLVIREIEHILTSWDLKI